MEPAPQNFPETLDDVDVFKFFPLDHVQLFGSARQELYTPASSFQTVFDKDWIKRPAVSRLLRARLS